MSDLFAGLTTTIKSTASAIARNEYVRKAAESMNDAIMSYSEPEQAVREATNEDPWGPTGPQMKKIAEYTRSGTREEFNTVYSTLFSRMLENNKDAWRRVYKSLVLFEHLLKNGSQRFVKESNDKLYGLRRLESYKFIDEKGKDQGINIRHRVKIIIEMMEDDSILEAEREKNRSEDKSKYRGYDQYDMKNSSSSFGSSSKNSWKNHQSSSEYDGYGRKKETAREVNNFSFSGNSTNNRSPSPELGFANDDEKPKKDDDDGFGDFVSSRSSKASTQAKIVPYSAPTKQANFANFNQPTSPIPPPIGSSSVPRKPSLTADSSMSNYDLLGDLNAPTSPPQNGRNNSIDLFAQLSPVTTQAAPVAPAAPSNGGLDLFDFGAPLTTSKPAPVNMNSNLGSLNDLDFGNMHSSTLGATAAPPKPSTQQQNSFGIEPSPKVGNSFAGLDQFMNLSLGSTGANAPKAKTLNQMKGGM